MPKRVYIISDLHIGGEYSKVDEPAGRGFRLCTHVDVLAQFVRSVLERGSRDNGVTELVINGDFVDFLAERREVRDPASGETSIGWEPFIYDPRQAVSVLRRILCRDMPIFVALKEFLAAGHRLTIMLGNHDIELSFPALRRVLAEELEADGKRFAFIYDGEAYPVGNVLIEHGNRYDEWNVVTHDTLRRVRSVQSRAEPTLDVSRSFEAPAGSFLVAGVMNEIKSRYPFIDLLKPESTAAIPILLALAPEYRARILTIADLVARSREHLVGPDGLPSYSGDIADSEMSEQLKTQGEIFVKRILREKLLAGSSEQFIAATMENPAYVEGDAAMGSGDIAQGALRSLWSKLKLLGARSSEPVSSRLPTLLAALEGTRDDFSFDRHKESNSYQSAAQRLLHGGFQVVVFGHTHLAKEITLPKGTYINTGTWADLLPFPTTILGTDDVAGTGSVEELRAARLSRLGKFVEDMATARLNSYLRFMPTYARIEMNGAGAVLSAQLCDYGGEGEVR
jgi:UDP-2,3-diacylglucosamine pyrophosphatase LpxH